MLDSSQFAFVGKTILNLSAPAIEENSAADLIQETSPSQFSAGFSEPVLAAIARLTEIVAELRSPMGGWPSDLPKTSENLIPYVLEEAYDVLDALEESPEISLIKEQEAKDPGQEAIDPRGKRERLIILDDLIPRLLWDVVKSSYDVMQLIGGVEAQVVRSGKKAYTGLIRLVVGLAVSSTDRPWFVDLATHNAGADRGDIEFCPVDVLIHCPDVTLCHEPIAAGDLIAQLRQQMQFANPELAKFMKPRPVEWLHPNSQWLTGLIEFTMDLELVPQIEANPPHLQQDSAEAVEQESVDLSGLLAPDPDLSNLMIRLSQPAILQESAKMPIKQALMSLVPQLQKVAQESNKNPAKTISPSRGAMLANDAGDQSPNVISQVVSYAYDLVEMWEFPWSEGQVAIDECLHRLLWQTITSSYAVMQLIGSVEAMVLTPGDDWEIGILRLLAIFELKAGSTNITVDLSTGQPIEIHQILTPKTIVRSPDIKLCQRPIMVENLLNTLKQQIQAATPAFEWLMNGAKVDWRNAGGNWESGSGQLQLQLELITAENS